MDFLQDHGLKAPWTPMSQFSSETVSSNSQKMYPSRSLSLLFRFHLIIFSSKRYVGILFLLITFFDSLPHFASYHIFYFKQVSFFKCNFLLCLHISLISSSCILCNPSSKVIAYKTPREPPLHTTIIFSYNFWLWFNKLLSPPLSTQFLSQAAYSTLSLSIISLPLPFLLFSFSILLPLFIFPRQDIFSHNFSPLKVHVSMFKFCLLQNEWFD